jgi:hypothetical protein
MAHQKKKTAPACAACYANRDQTPYVMQPCKTRIVETCEFAKFFKYTNVPTTVLAVKDRVTGHNPLAAVYQADSYYRKIRHPDL